MMDTERLWSFVRDAQVMIDHGDVEDRLRHFLSTSLSSIFPDSPWWVRAHALGSEEHVRFANVHGTERGGFVDTVIGKTAVEYEKNLTRPAIFNEGYRQVREYCAALRNAGIPKDEILGVLSDTVRWYGYKVHTTDLPEGRTLFGADDVTLTEIASVDLSVGSAEEAQRFETFVTQFFDRDSSRLLNADTLAMDFGVDSSFYGEHIATIRDTISQAMDTKPEYAEFIKQLWQNFVSYLGVSDYGSFSLETYVNEFYLVTTAKTICANMLAGEPVISDSSGIKMIINGSYFATKNISNFVDYDYFGWLNNDPFADSFVGFVAEMQNSMKAYDFSRIPDKDLFGKLLAQLANREHRLLLGQEFTPYWIAWEMAGYCLEHLGDNAPRAMDMCCGSGVFLIEMIKAVRREYGISVDNYSDEKDAIAFSCVMGFDIDPLAVMLAKVNWIIAMQDLFPLHQGDITVPIYHADSLFVDTPIMRRMVGADGETYTFRFDRDEVALPGFLFQAEHRRLFDAFMAKIHHISMARAVETNPGTLCFSLVDRLIEATEADSDTVLEATERETLFAPAIQLIMELERLQREGRNGIWHFILCNSYRPSLSRRQFNCIISNPPWMAMSKLANNPYKHSLQEIATKYGIRPTGASHPHMELATIFLLSAVDRYLDDGACWSCIMPGSLLGGFNHNALRLERYRTSDAGLTLRVTEIWDLPATAFKNKAIVLSGEKSAGMSPDELDGRCYSDGGQFSPCVYTLVRQGERTAWTNSGRNVTLAEAIGDGGVNFTQGADLMPRTVVFHKTINRPGGRWDLEPITEDSDLRYLMNDVHQWNCKDLVAAGVSGAYMYDAYLSKHMSPFFVAEPAKAFIPGRSEGGKWRPVDAGERALVSAGTEAAFAQIEAGMGMNLAAYFTRKVNLRNKLDQQNFSTGNWLVLSNAGGANPCAAFVDLSGKDRTRILVDQTLYWHIAQSKEEALYIVGMLNSSAMSEAIKDFQPDGGFGKRHIHTIPYKMIPPFNEDNPVHVEIMEKTQILMNEWLSLGGGDGIGRYLEPGSGTLSMRRRRQQTAIRELSSFSAYDLACKILFE